MNENLPRQLAERLARPLPGWSAQADFQPELSFGRHRGPAAPHARMAAVLLLLYPHQGRWHIPFILRPAHMVEHANQVSLPGGTIEPSESSHDAALREFYEELGAPSDRIQMLGRLSDLYLFASNFVITPWVGAVDTVPDWQPSQHEVERLLEIPVDHLLAPSTRDCATRLLRGVEFSIPCFRWETEVIWGATSMVLAEFLAVVREFHS